MSDEASAGALSDSDFDELIAANDGCRQAVEDLAAAGAVPPHLARMMAKQADAALDMAANARGQGGTRH